MIDRKKYGVVYTPDKLAEFVSQLMIEEGDLADVTRMQILDPACGEGALLDAAYKLLGKEVSYIGIDIDADILKKNILHFGNEMRFYEEDFILPKKVNDPVKYWKKNIGKINYIIANPPWSTDKLYDKHDLERCGYKFVNGQYDNYVLFIESCLELIEENGVCAFILPDSIFAGENKRLRKMLCEKTIICVIARLGEKIFKDVNRATSVLIVKKKIPNEKTYVKCFRLSTDDRKMFLEGSGNLYDYYEKSMHLVKQSRFMETDECLFDVDILEADEQLIRKIQNNKIEWKKIFSFGRGVEISKSGKVVICQYCHRAQGYTKKQEELHSKKCGKCGKIIKINNQSMRKLISDRLDEDDMKIIYVGENIHRYEIRNNKYIKLNVQGINYKNPSLYIPPKILIRKTGLGIDACIDNKSTYISQTIYSCQYLKKNNNTPLEYYLALLNSRVIYYYYIKQYGENEWKSHPYFTKDIIFSLPLKEYVDTELTQEIVLLAKKLLSNYDRNIDLLLEEKIMKLYDLTEEEIKKIKKELSELPNLGAINNMKF